GPRIVDGSNFGIGAGARMMLLDASSGGTAPRVKPTPFAQPRAVVYRKKTNTLLVASEATDAVVELDARSLDPAMHMRDRHTYEQCGAPSGIALSADEDTAWIHCRSTDRILVLSFAWTGPRPIVQLAESRLTAIAERGRRLFYAGNDPK